jgi:hypothetical protein
MRSAMPLGDARSYRCYLLNSDNSFRKAQEFRSLSDDEAKQRAKAWLDLVENQGARGVELWTREQCVLSHKRGMIVPTSSTD